MARQLFILILLSLCIGFAAAQDAAPETTAAFTDHPARVVGNINALNVRSAPAIADGNIIGRLSPGQQVHVLAREGDWQQVRREDGLAGWAHSGYLIDLPPRQIGETRLFRYSTPGGLARQSAAVLHYIGEHSYIYIAEADYDLEQDIDPLWLERLGRTIDEELYPQTSALWQGPLRPNHGGDERAVILLADGAGGYHVRSQMPGEPQPSANRAGYIELNAPAGLRDEGQHYRAAEVTAHELQHLFAHTLVKQAIPALVDEGIATFGALYLGYRDISELIASEFLATLYTSPQDFQYELRHYGAALLFSTYLYEQLGREALLAFAQSATSGLDSLADLLAELAPARADTFFADWALANRLLNPRLGDGRYGYHLLEGANLSGAAFSARIQSLPTRVESSLAPYATAYYEIALPDDAGGTALALDWQFADGSQDGWLQLAQVVAGELTVERYRVGDSDGTEFQATLHPAAEQAFLAISPLPENDGDSREPLSFTLLLRAAGSAPAASDYAEPLPLLVSIPAELGLDLSHLDEHSAPLSLALGVQSLIEAYAAKRNELYQARNWAAFAQIEQKVRQLLAFGADVRRMDAGAVTRVVSEIYEPRLLAMLLAAGANPDDRLMGGYFTVPEAPALRFPTSALHYAVMLDDEESLQLLIEAGATLNPIRRGLSPLHLAAALGNRHFAQLLLDAGADAAILDWSGVTASDLAREGGHHEIVALLAASLAGE